jgi:hypothetical protein
MSLPIRHVERFLLRLISDPEFAARQGIGDDFERALLLASIGDGLEVFLIGGPRDGETMRLWPSLGVSVMCGCPLMIPKPREPMHYWRRESIVEKDLGPTAVAYRIDARLRGPRGEPVVVADA